jgi:hypothetical protein
LRGWVNLVYLYNENFKTSVEGFFLAAPNETIGSKETIATFFIGYVQSYKWLDTSSDSDKVVQGVLQSCN